MSLSALGLLTADISGDKSNLYSLLTGQRELKRIMVEMNAELKNGRHYADHAKKPDTYGRAVARVAEGAGINLAGRILGGGIQYVYMVVAARLLGVESFGLLVLAFTIVTFGGVVGRMGMEMAVIKFVSRFHGETDRNSAAGAIYQALRTSLFVSLVLAVVLFLIAPHLSSEIFKEERLSEIVKVLSVVLPFSAFMSITLASTQGFHLMKYSVYGQNIIQPSLNIVMLVLFVVLGFGLFGAAAAHLISVMITCVISYYFLVSTFPSAKNLRKSAVKVPGMLKYAISVAPVLFFNFVLMWTDTLMLGHYRSAFEVGIYSSAMRTAMISTLIISSFSTIFAPMASDLFARQEIGRLNDLFKVVTKWTYLINLAVFLLIILMPMEIIGIFGKGFEDGAGALKILALAQIVNTITGVAGVILVMVEKERLMFYNAFGAVLVNVFLNYVLIPLYGITGAAYATASTIIAVDLVMLAQVMWLLKIHPYSKEFVKITVCGMLACGTVSIIMALWPVAAQGIYKLLVFVPLFLGTYGLSIFFMGLGKEDRLILDMVRRKFSAVSRREGLYE